MNICSYVEENKMKETEDFKKAHLKIKDYVEKEMPNDDTMLSLANLYSIFSDPMRLRILIALSKNSLSVGDLTEVLSTSQSNISHHLAILRDNDLVSFTKSGKRVIYYLKDAHVHLIIQMGLEHILED